MRPEVQVELIRLLTAVLWIMLLVIVIAVFYRQIRDELLPRISGVKAFGFELTFAREDLNRAIEAQASRVSVKASERLSQEITTKEREQVLRRARRTADVVVGSRMLWVDDHPANNRDLVRLLTSLGATVDVARSSQEALDLLDRYDYDVVISDMDRDGVRDAGKRFVDAMPGRRPWVIFFIGAPFDPSLGVPKGVLGGTYRPDELLHLVLDALERERV